MKTNRGIRVIASCTLALLLALAFGALIPTTSWASYPPTIASVTPSSAEIGDIILIKSSGGAYGFRDTPGTVEFNINYPARGSVVVWTNDSIEVVVPYNAYGGGITVKTSDGYTAEYYDFYVKANIDRAFPKRVVQGQAVTLNGAGFGQGSVSTEVHFYNASSGDVTVGGMNYVSGGKNTNLQQFYTKDIASGTYEVYVATYVSTTTIFRIESNRVSVTVEGPPVIDSVSPNPCPAGATLTIKGSGFGDVYDDDNLDLYMKEVKTGKIWDYIPPLDFGPDIIMIKGQPYFNGTFHIVVNRGVSAPSPGGRTALGSNEAEVTFTSDPVPAQDVVNQTSRTWGHDSIGVTSHAAEWYLPEAGTANGDESWVLVQNPNSTPAKVTLTYITASGVKEMPADTVEPSSRKTYNVADALPNTAGISVKVKSDIPVAAEKAVYGNHRTWAHESVGVSQAAKQWYLAEGCTAPGYSARIAVMNPSDTDANISLTYMTPTGPKTGPSEVLRANSRTSYDVAATVPDEWSVSTEVKSNVPVAAERAMFGNNSAWAHDSVGVTSASTVWYLAEGCTASNFETWVLVQNPGDQTANVSLTYMTSSGAVAGPTDAVAPKSRKTFEVAKNVPGAWEVSTKVTSDQPVVVERALYGNNRSWATDSVGVTEPNTTWYLAEGCTLPWLETWILLQNPSDKKTQFKITYNTASGAVAGPAETLAPNSRKTYNPAYVVNNTADVSTMVESDNPIVVERAMYGDPR